MDFSEMKLVWDSQNEKPLYVMDEAALHSSIRRKSICIEKYIAAFEYVLVGCLPVVALILTAKRLYSGVATESWQIAAVWLMPVVGILATTIGISARWRRQARERDYPPTLMGDLDKAISKLEYQAKRVKLMHWHFTLPMMVIGILSSASKGRTIAELFEGPRIWIWPLMAVFLVLLYFGSRMSNRPSACSRDNSLRALREKLSREEPAA